jgi:hypothetical protein
MDEMQLLKELGDRTPLATADDLAPARELFLTRTRTSKPRRFALYGGAVIGMAAAIFAVFALIPPEQSPAPTANADPVQVLRQAAAAALKVPDITPRPDQFVYTRTQYPEGKVHEVWASVDDTHDGFEKRPNGEDRERPGCRNGKRKVVNANKLTPGMTEDCVPEPAYQPDLPTDAAGMIALLRKNNDSLNSTGKDIGSMLSTVYMRPQSRAALYEAATQIDGLTATTGVTDAVGRPGIQIGWDKDGYSSDFIVDAETYVYLGYRENSALLAMTIVDKVGQRP